MRKRSRLNLYNKDGSNYVEYNSEEIPIINKPKLPDIEQQTYPITIEYQFRNDLKVGINDYCEYQVINPEHSQIVNSGSISTLNIDSPDEIDIYIKNCSNETDKVMTIKIRYEDFDKNIEYDRNEIKNKINDPYIDKTNKNVFTESDNKNEENVFHYSDLEIINDVDYLQEIDYIDGGSYRLVYKIKHPNALDLSKSYKDNVIKIARSPKGIVANRKEFETWSVVRSNQTLKKYFCPIVHKGPEFKYIIMNEGDIISSKSDIVEKMKSREDIENTVREAISGIETPTGGDAFDIKYSNIAEYDGRPVLVDYPYGGKFSFDESIIKEFEEKDEDEKYPQFD